MHEKPIHESLQEYGRGVIGGLIFSLPVLYTMEVWYASFDAAPQMLLLYLALTFVLLLGYNTYAGLRQDASWKEVAVDSVEEMGIGMVLSFLFLLLLGRIELDDMSLKRIVYMVVVEAMPVAMGVSIGTAQLGSSHENVGAGLQPHGKSNDSIHGKKQLTQSSTLELIALSVCAGMILVSPIAPTDEVYLIAISIKPYLALIIVLTSLALTGGVVFYIGFRGSYETPANKPPKFLEVVWNICITYAAAFCISAGALWFFGRFNQQGFQNSVHMTVVLSIVATLGASAGRLLLDSSGPSESGDNDQRYE